MDEAFSTEPVQAFRKGQTVRMIGPSVVVTIRSENPPIGTVGIVTRTSLHSDGGTREYMYHVKWFIQPHEGSVWFEKYYAHELELLAT